MSNDRYLWDLSCIVSARGASGDGGFYITRNCVCETFLEGLAMVDGGSLDSLL